MRLNKFIASCGAASRRGADTMISDGRVTINGQTVSTMGVDVDTEKDTICVDGIPLVPEEKKIYIMLNKPAGIISSCHDEKGRKTVMDLLEGINQRVFPVGRLDYDTEGLLLLTNDGDFAYQCTHPKHELNKTYEAVVQGVLDDNTLMSLRNGIMLDNVKTSKARIHVVSRSENKSNITITIHEGRNRQVKRMFEAVGCSVLRLKRISIGELILAGLEPGHWRYLTQKELSMLGIEE